jgi:hypothetical protein
MASVIFGVKTGEVFIRNYDEGLVKTIGGVLGTDSNGSQGYLINIPGICMPDGTSNVPIIFEYPDQTTTKKVIPAIYISGGDATPAMNRWMSVGQKEYRIWVTGVDVITGIGEDGSTVTGYSMVESKVQDMPFDITYTITIIARTSNDANLMLRMLLRVLKPYCKIDIVDSLGDTRSYNAQLDGAVSRLTNITDATDREKGFTINLLVEGELTLTDPAQFKTVSGFVTSYEVKK